VFHLPDSWVWDFWIADTGDEYHLFFLFASRALGDPDRRHRRASIGHARSHDLVHWDRLADAVVRSDAPAFDDVATWTGSIVRAGDDDWRIFYTGLSDHPIPQVQRIGVARSRDLMTWATRPEPLVVADPAFYSTAESGDEPWRDPWVFQDENGLWHMLITARSAGWSDLRDSGVLGHATSEDLDTWTVHPPATGPGHGFGQLEVPQVVETRSGHVLIFSCLNGELAERRRTPGGGGVWAAPAGGASGPFDLDRAALITDSSRYAGRVMRDRAGILQLLAFRNEEDGAFVGVLGDPTPLEPLLDQAFSSAREE